MSSIKVVNHTLELRLIAPMSPAVIDEVDDDRFGQAVQDGVDQFGRLVVEGNIGLRLELLKDRFQHPPMPAGMCGGP